MSTKPLAAAIYEEQLVSLAEGLPLWEPDPGSNQPPVEIADVGYLSSGGWIRLFNASKPIDDPSNDLGVPEGYQQLAIGKIQERAPLLARVPMFSESVTQKEVGGALSGPSSFPIQVTCGFSFQCSREHGAVLVLGDDADRRDALHKQDFAQLIIEQSTNWLRFADDVHRRGIMLDDLVLVTGCDKTSSWACAAFSKESTEASISFGAGQPAIAQGSASLSWTWRNCSSVAIRSGPRRAMTSTLYQDLTSSDIRVLDHEGVEDFSTPTNATPPSRAPTRDQCIFLRGYKVCDRKTWGTRRLLRRKKKYDGFEYMLRKRREDPEDPEDPGSGHFGRSRTRPSQSTSGKSTASSSGRNESRTTSSSVSGGPSDGQESSSSVGPDGTESDSSDCGNGIGLPLNMLLDQSTETTLWNIIFDFILENSSANIALVHSDDLIFLMRTYGPTTDFARLMHCASPQILVNNQVGILETAHYTDPGSPSDFNMRPINHVCSESRAAGFNLTPTPHISVSNSLGSALDSGRDTTTTFPRETSVHKYRLLPLNNPAFVDKHFKRVYVHGNMRFRCSWPKCSIGSFLTRITARKHVLEHLGINSFECIKRGRRFSNESAAVAHNKTPSEPYLPRHRPGGESFPRKDPRKVSLGVFHDDNAGESLISTQINSTSTPLSNIKHEQDVGTLKPEGYHHLRISPDEDAEEQFQKSRADLGVEAAEESAEASPNGPFGGAYFDETSTKGIRSTKNERLILHETIGMMSQRMLLLEEALETLQSHVSSQPHPMLVGKSKKSTHSAVHARLKEAISPIEEELFHPLGAFSIGDHGETVFHEASAMSEYLMNSPLSSALRTSPPRNLTGTSLSMEFITLSALFPFPPDTVGAVLEDFLPHLPPYPRARFLAEIYFWNAAWSVDPVHRRNFMHNVFTECYVDEQPSMKRISVDRLSSLFMVFAVGAFFDTDRSLCAQEPEDFYILARACLCMRPVYDYPTVYAVQTMTLMMWFQTLAGHHTQSSRPLLWGVLHTVCELMNLNRDPKKLGIEGIEAEVREVAFWEVKSLEQWQAFEGGRPVVNYVVEDVKRPYEDANNNNPGSQNAALWLGWKQRWTDMVNSVADAAFRSNGTTYSQILKLDKQLRHHHTPVPLRWPSTKGAMYQRLGHDPLTGMQCMARMILQESGLLHLHRWFFMQVLFDQPSDPLEHMFAHSVRTVYQSASCILMCLGTMYGYHPSLISRCRFAWSNGFSAALTMGTFVLYYPTTPLAQPAMIEFERACTLFQKTVATSVQPENASVALQNLLQNARRVRAEACLRLGEKRTRDTSALVLPVPV